MRAMVIISWTLVGINWAIDVVSLMLMTFTKEGKDIIKPQSMLRWILEDTVATVWAIFFSKLFW